MFTIAVNSTINYTSYVYNASQGAGFSTLTSLVIASLIPASIAALPLYAGYKVVQFSKSQKLQWDYKVAERALRNAPTLEEKLPLQQTVLDLHQKIAGEKAPSNIPHWNNLGLILGQLGRYEEALVHFEYALSLPGAKTQDTLLSSYQAAVALHKLGNPKKALEHLNYAESFIPEGANSHPLANAIFNLQRRILDELSPPQPKQPPSFLSRLLGW